MEFEKTADGTRLEVRLIGDVDSAAAEMIKTTLANEVKGVNELVLDLKDLEYISSSGIRLLFGLRKKIKTQGRIVIINADDEIVEIFKVTGILRFLDIQ